MGAYGKEWAKKVKGNERLFPTFVELISGIERWYTKQMKQKIEGKDEKQKQRICNSFKNTWKKLAKASDIQRVNEPLEYSYEYRKDEELGLLSPYSSISAFVLYVYSMELGDPPLYAVLNRAMRDKDLIDLEDLGPFARALSEVTYRAEDHREKDDKIQTGRAIREAKGEGVVDNFSGIFSLFRGSPMK